MGFPKDEAEMAVVRCGMLSSEVVANVFLVMLIIINKNPIPISLVYIGDIMVFCILITYFTHFLIPRLSFSLLDYVVKF